MRSVTALLVLLAACCVTTSNAQQPAFRWEDLNALKAGEKIQVVEADLKSWSGAYIRLADDAISLRVDKGVLRRQEKTVPRSSVLRVTRLSHGRNALIGLGVGAAVGGGIAAGLSSRIDKGYGGALTKGGLAAMMLTVCGGSGALIGYSIPAHRTLYRISPAS